MPGMELTPTNPVTLKPQSYKLPTQVITFLDFHFYDWKIIWAHMTLLVGTVIQAFAINWYLLSSITSVFKIIILGNHEVNLNKKWTKSCF